MVIQNNHSRQVFFSEFKQDVSNDTAELNQVSICSHTNDEKTQLTRAEGTVGGNCETAHHEKSVATANKDMVIEQSAKVLGIEFSGFAMVQIGCQVQSCKWCGKNCHSSSDEENDSVTKNQEVEADSHGAQVDLVFELKGKLGSKMIHFPVPVIKKRGCLKSSQYISLIAELHDLRGSGDFVAHEQIVQKHLAKTRDVDMEVSLQIERAKALYFQNNVEDVKKILKFVLKQEVQLKNPGILTGRALNLLTAVYKRQGKFGYAMECVEKATSALEHQACQDSRDDKAELHHSHGALLGALPAEQRNHQEAYKCYHTACRYTSNNRECMYINVKMAALLLKSCSKAVNNDTTPSRENVLKAAERHLNLVGDTDMGLGTNIKHLLLWSDLHCFKQNVPMAIERAKEARELIHRHGFELELVSAEKRISHLSELPNEEWRNREMGSSNEYLADSEGESACVE